MSTLGSFICVRNGFELDYSFQLAAESLLKVCDQLILCDSDSTDGTRQALQRMADRDRRITVINWPWPNPVRESHHWFLKWLRFAQSHLKTDMVLYLDADEVLDDSPECHQAIREAKNFGRCLAVDRLNYWRDAYSLIPDGECCGKWCVRMGLTKYPVVSDEPNAAGEQPMVDNAVKEPRVKIHHLGFLRDKDAFYRKARVVLNTWFGRFDPRLEAGEQQGKPVWETECDFTDRLTRFEGYMPDGVQRWLCERGHFTPSYVPRIIIPPDPVIQITETRTPQEPIGILHYGDFGDIIHMLPICQAIGRVNLYFQDRNSICKRILERLHILAPLLESQSYVNIAKPHDGEPIHWNAGEFRIHHELTRSLAWAHLMHYNGNQSLPPVAPHFQLPWLTGIEPDPRGNGRIIINRTTRYPNRMFRWREIVQHYGTRLLFVGSREEHNIFCGRFGTVPYHPTEDLLEVARLIAASALFIGNQSACFAIAEGMKHRRLLEVCLEQPDVIVARDTALHMSPDGSLDIPAMLGRPALQCPAILTLVNYLKNPNTQPRTGWSVAPPFSKKPHHDVSHGTLKRRLMKMEGPMTDDEAHRAIFDALAAREPDYFASGQQQAELRLFKEAVANASDYL